MAYGNYKNIQEVAKKYQIELRIESFVDAAPVPVAQHFVEELEYDIRNIDVKMSEASIDEFLVAPILKEVWKRYSDALLFWSHVALKLGDEFDGFPDYLFTKRSALGLVRDKPYLVVVEAKKDDFSEGWAQCLFALIVAQEINQNEPLRLYGIVSTGEVWQFAHLQSKRFIRDPRSFTISDLPELFGTLQYVFEQAKQQSNA